MTANRPEQVRLEITRGMMVAILVVLGIGWIGRPTEQTKNRSGLMFGSWTAPQIRPVQDHPLRWAESRLQIDRVDDFVFFFVDPLDDGQGPSSMAFINRKRSLLGEIKPFDPSRDSWPPSPVEFGLAANLLRNQADPGAAELEIGPMRGIQLQVQTIRYDDADIVWASPRKSPAWPLRIHIGKCQVGDQTLLVSVYEMEAKDPIPDYTAGPISALARALHPL